MEKPISLIITEAKEELAKTINGLQLHPAILELILKDVYFNVQMLSKQQAEKEFAEYNKEKEKEKEKEKNTESKKQKDIK